MTQQQPNIELHIEELILHGFAPGDHHAIVAAVQQELARLFAEQGIPASLMQSVPNDPAISPVVGTTLVRPRVADIPPGRDKSVPTTGETRVPTTASFEIAHLHGGSFTVARGSQADVIGAQVAQAVYGGMKHE